MTHYALIIMTDINKDTNTDINKDINKDTNKDNDNDIKTYRYKFSPDIVKALYEFSKLHQYDTRKNYKESWEKWTIENDELVSTEIRRLMINNYTGNVVDKMYKSSRYYFRRKSTVKVDPKERRKYVSCSRTIIDHMDNYIMRNYKDTNFKPAKNYTVYCNDNKDLIKTEINKIKTENKLEESQILDKIRKTFKNRYFQLIKNK